MQDLMHFSQDRALRPNAAVDALATEYTKPGEGNVTSNPQMMAAGNAPNGTPRMMKMGAPAGFVNSSPGMTHMNLPMQNGVMNGSPHFNHTAIPGMQGQMGMANSSPAQSHMAPPMVPQHSQQGTNSTAASADTSPQVSNKRRRSTVKAEEDGGGGDAKVKPSPRMGKKAKPS